MAKNKIIRDCQSVVPWRPHIFSEIAGLKTAFMIECQILEIPVTNDMALEEAWSQEAKRHTDAKS